MLVDALGRHADEYDYLSGGVITGYVAVYEITLLDGRRSVMWITGDGSDPEAERRNGLKLWRVDGLLRQAIRDIIADASEQASEE